MKTHFVVRRLTAAGLAVFATTVPSLAEARSVAEFLQIAEPLRAKGIVGMYSDDFGKLNSEADAALANWLKLSKLARPKVCANADAVHMSVDGFLDLLRSIPASKRFDTSVDAAVKNILDARYRCRR